MPEQTPPVVLSPDLKMYWDGARWLPTTVSPDGKWIWTGQAWQLFESVAASSAVKRAGSNSSVYAWLICSGGTLGLLIVGNALAKPAGPFVEAVATGPVIFLHSVKELIEGRKVVLPSPRSLLNLAASGAHGGNWITTGIIFRVVLGLIDNVVGGLILSPASLGLGGLLVIAMPILLGFVIGWRTLRRGRRIVIVMAAVGGLINISSTFLFFGSAPVDFSSPYGIGFLLGLPVGMVLLSGAGLLGHEVGGVLAKRRQGQPTIQPAFALPLPPPPTSPMPQQSTSSAPQTPSPPTPPQAAPAVAESRTAAVTDSSAGTPIDSRAETSNVAAAHKDARTTRFCRQCGAKVGLDDRFCAACGVAVRTD